MIESVLYLLKVHGKMVFGNPSIVVEDMLGVAPESFDAVDVIFPSVGEGLGVVESVVFSPALEGVVASEGVGVVDRTFSRMVPDMGHEFVGCDPFHHFGVDSSVPLQEPEYDAFSRGAPSPPFPFPSATEVGLVHLNLPLQFPGLQFGHMVDGLPQLVVHPGHRLVVDPQIHGEAIGGLELIESGDEGDLLPKPLEGFLPMATETFHIPPIRPADLERTTKNAFSAPQKVGRTVKNVVSSSNHKGILAPPGYKTH